MALFPFLLRECCCPHWVGVSAKKMHKGKVLIRLRIYLGRYSQLAILIQPEMAEQIVLASLTKFVAICRSDYACSSACVAAGQENPIAGSGFHT